MNFVSAIAKDSRRVRVTLSAAPLATSPALVGDALNPATWAVTEVGGGGIVLEVLRAALVSASVVDVLVDAPLVAFPGTMRVSAPTLLDALGVPVTPPTFADLSGLGEASSPAQPRGPSAPVDVKNEQVPSDVTFGGTLVVTPEGDYASEQGTALLKKLMLRRLFTAPGDFFHIPTYGLGLRPKTIVAPSSLPTLKKRAEQQIALEPDVAAVSVSLSLDAGGTLTVRARARQRSTGLVAEVEQRVVVQL